MRQWNARAVRYREAVVSIDCPVELLPLIADCCVQSVVIIGPVAPLLHRFASEQ